MDMNRVWETSNSMMLNLWWAHAASIFQRAADFDIRRDLISVSTMINDAPLLKAYDEMARSELTKISIAFVLKRGDSRAEGVRELN